MSKLLRWGVNLSRVGSLDGASGSGIGSEGAGVFSNKFLGVGVWT